MIMSPVVSPAVGVRIVRFSTDEILKPLYGRHRATMTLIWLEVAKRF